MCLMLSARCQQRKSVCTSQRESFSLLRKLSLTKARCLRPEHNVKNKQIVHTLICNLDTLFVQTFVVIAELIELLCNGLTRMSFSFSKISLQSNQHKLHCATGKCVTIPTNRYVLKLIKNEQFALT